MKEYHKGTIRGLGLRVEGSVMFFPISDMIRSPEFCGRSVGSGFRV